MKNITIGVAGPEWRLAAAAQYYAERGRGEEYAFGCSPAEALENLEKREAAASGKFDEGLAEEIAFLALGAAEFLKNHRHADLGSHDGYMGFIGEVTRHAPMLTKRWQQMKDGEFCGVWLYDITERFGREWAEDILTSTGISALERLDCIIEDEMGK